MFAQNKCFVTLGSTVTQFLASLDDDSGEKRYQWDQLKKYIIDTKVQERYDALYKKGFYEVFNNACRSNLKLGI